jgi:TonB family protein
MEIVAPKVPVDSNFTEFSIREDVGIPHFVRLHDKATKRFESQVRGFGATPSGSSRAGGILLGTLEWTDKCHINVQDFTPVLCEHRRDGRNSFLDCPAQCFRNAIRRANEGAKKNHSIVGYYRSSGGPEFPLEKEDHDLFKKYFAENVRFLLLVKPSPAGYATAVFYLGIDGQLHPNRCSVEFPLSLKELGGEEPPEPDEPGDAIVIPAAAPTIEPVRVAAPPVAASVSQALPAQAVQELVQQSRRSEQFWKGAAAAAILLGSVFAVRSIVTTSRQETAVIQPAPVAPAAPASSVATGPFDRANKDAPKPKEISRPEPVARKEEPQRVAVAPPPIAGAPAKTSLAQPVEVRKFSPPPQAAPANSLLSPAPELPAPALPAAAVPVAQTPAIPTPRPPVSRPEPNPPVSQPPAPVVSAPSAPQQAPLKPPRLVRQSTPVVPEQMKRKLRGETIVAVLVDVDASGKVINAVPTAKTAKGNASLASLAVEAARQSQFEPATRGDQKVAGQATLQFRFEGEMIRLPVQPSMR